MNSERHTVTCPQCGQTSNIGVRECWNCGLPFRTRRRRREEPTPEIVRLLLVILLALLALGWVKFMSVPKHFKAVSEFVSRPVINSLKHSQEEVKKQREAERTSLTAPKSRTTK